MPSRYYRPQRDPAPATDQEKRPCDWPGCDGEGLFRAPRSPRELYAYQWFCLDHVRQYNAAWNYYDGMDDTEVEADVRRDTVWHRPSWPLGGAGRTGFDGVGHIKDPFGLFDEAEAEPPRRGRTASPEEQAMVVLDLRPPLSTAAVKARYKELVKRHHPDANGGDKASEEKFKQITQAYETIMDSLTP